MGRSGDTWDEPTASRPAYRILKDERSFGRQMSDSDGTALNQGGLSGQGLLAIAYKIAWKTTGGEAIINE
jgi:hypothetical protein